MELRSLFLVVSYLGNSTCSTSILHLDTQKGYNSGFGPHFKPPPGYKWVRPPRRWSSFSHFGTRAAAAGVDLKEYVAHFGRQQGPANISWSFSHMTTTTTSGEEELLYMLPNWAPGGHTIEDVPLHGFMFNLNTKTCLPFRHHKANKFGGRVVNLYGYLYFISDPSWAPSPGFERYDPARDSWDTLPPFPSHLGNTTHIVATAVFHDTILFNLGGVQIWAYHVLLGKWHPVEVEDKQCYRFVGEAVVLGNTIYALPDTFRPFNLVLALSLVRKKLCNGDFLYKCRLLAPILVQGLKPFHIKESFSHTRHLCHLGEDRICLVQSCNLYDYPQYQPIQLTNIKLLKEEEHSMTVTDVCGHLLQFPDDHPFVVDFCFSLPDSKATALKDGKTFRFALNPYPEDYDPHGKRKDLLFSEPKEDIVTASGRSNTDEEGHSIYVRNISPFATCDQLKKELAKFGPVDGIRIIMSVDLETFAFVQYKSETSKQNAIKASPILIGGCRAVIE